MNRKQRRFESRQSGRSEAPRDGDPPVIRDKLALAMQLHRAGDYAGAERLYREILAFDPGHADALNLLGVMAHQLGHHEAAVALIEQAIARRGGEASFHYNLGAALKAQGKAEAASDSFERALQLKPDYAEAHNNLGNLHREAGRLEAAASCFGRALALKPELAEAHNNLGGVEEIQGRLAAAEASFRRAVAARPDFVLAWCNLGRVLLALGRPDEAGARYRQALTLKPDCAEAENGLGTVLAGQGRHDEAMAWYGQALARRPDFAEAHYNLALAFAAEGRFAEAIEAHRRALQHAPRYVEAWNNLGVALQVEGRFAEAVAAYEKAVALRPDNAMSHNNLGTALQSLGRPEAALASYRRALALAPDYAGARMNLATCLLLTGELRQGFAAFQARWQVPDSPIRMPDLPRPLWAGEDPAGRRILVHCEQGLGDSLQFIRYATLLAGQGAQVIVLTPPALARLFRSIPGIEIVEAIPEPDSYDCHIPLLCLPSLLGTELATIPAAIPYLAPDQLQVRSWAVRLAATSPRPRIGLVWAGAPRTADPQAYAVDRRRSLALAQLAPLADVPNLRFISLQKGPPARQAPPPGLELLDVADELEDFADTAALIANLDLIIGVDTSVPHLAGALGKPVWLLSRFDGCWRWLLDRTDSPWYPTLRLFRQTAPGDWVSVIREVRQALADWAAAWQEADPQNPPLAAPPPVVL